MDGIVEKLLALGVRDVLKVGGYFGGHLTESIAQKLQETGHYNCKKHHEQVLEMYGYEKTDYWVITRTC